MDGVIVKAERPVTLLGGGELPAGLLEESLGLAPILVAADGAADVALAAGRLPDAVVGDMDSISPRARAAIPAERIHPIAEQESTDFDKALRSIAAPLVLAVGFTGARLDHELAVYNALVRHASRRCIVIGSHDICLHVPGRLSLDLAPGTRLSLFPLAPVRVSASGLRWPLRELELSPVGRIGTSNETTGRAVEIVASGPGLLAILPRDRLAAAAAAITARRGA